MGSTTTPGRTKFKWNFRRIQCKAKTFLCSSWVCRFWRVRIISAFFFLILCPVAFTICPRDKTSTMSSLQSHAIASFKPGTWVPKDSRFLLVHVYPCQFYRSRSNHWQQSCWKTNNRSVLAHNACSVYLCILTAWGEGGGVWEFPALNIHPAETQTAIKT